MDVCAVAMLQEALTQCCDIRWELFLFLGASSWIAFGAPTGTGFEEFQILFLFLGRASWIAFGVPAGNAFEEFQILFLFLGKSSSNVVGVSCRERF